MKFSFPAPSAGFRCGASSLGDNPYSNWEGPVVVSQVRVQLELSGCGFVWLLLLLGHLFCRLALCAVCLV